MSLVTAGIMLVVYGGYFLATYLGCKSMIRPKKINITYETLSIYQRKTGLRIETRVGFIS